MGDVPDDNERRRLGLDTHITRRDFVNGALVGAGGAAARRAVCRQFARGHPRY